MAPKRARPGADTVIGAADASRPAKKPRRLGRRDTGEQVDRAIKEHCPEATAEQVDVHTIGSSTFREEVTTDKRAAKVGHYHFVILLYLLQILS